jgi:predicted nucleic acid-binding protein
MNVFVDTSAIIAIIDTDDEFHDDAVRVLESLGKADATLVTTSYVVVETFALLQGRIGLDAARAFHENLFPLMGVHWIDEDAHRAAAASLLTASRQKLSLVDCASFQTMRQLGLRKAFTFDSHFMKQGFTALP